MKTMRLNGIELVGRRHLTAFQTDFYTIMLPRPACMSSDAMYDTREEGHMLRNVRQLYI